MIAYISGKIVYKTQNSIVVKLASGEGYLVYIDRAFEHMVHEHVDLFIYESRREDKTDLYGFYTSEDWEWVEKLLKVSGVGPKMAASIVHSLGSDKIQSAIINQDIQALCEVKGLGQKTAKKIVLELKGSKTDITMMETDLPGGSSITDFTETLSNLGYKRSQIVSVISQLKKERLWNEDDLVEMVKIGLKYLNSFR